MIFHKKVIMNQQINKREKRELKISFSKTEIICLAFIVSLLKVNFLENFIDYYIWFFLDTWVN